MPAYIIANAEVTDPKAYEAYRAAVPAILERFGGRFLVRGGEAEILEGSFPGPRFVVLEFPDIAAARAFASSPDYAAAKAHREGAALMNFAIVEGFTP